MSALLALPVELLELIFSFVGSDYFRGQAERLLVCRLWKQIAHRAAWEHVTLDSRQIIRFTRAAARPYHELVWAHIKHLSLVLSDFVDWDPLERYSSHERLFCDAIQDDDGLTELDYLDLSSEMWLDWWVVFLNRALSNLARSFRKLVRLQTFRLEVALGEKPENLFSLRPHAWLWDVTFGDIIRGLGQPNLHTVVIDTRGTAITRQGARHGSLDSHVCDVIGKQMHRWRHVRLRMRRICSDVLTTCSLRTPQACLLQTLSIHLSLSDPRVDGWDPQLAENDDPSPDPGRLSGGWEVYEDLVAAGVAALPRMPRLRSARILCHNEVPLRIVAHDYVTGRRTKFSEGTWDWEDPDEETDHDDDSYRGEDSPTSDVTDHGGDLLTHDPDVGQ